jgi:UDP-glucose 4-epimerase
MGSPQKLRWSYADSKALEEAMAHALFLANGLEVITLRFFNVVGPRQLGSYGMVLPRFVESALRNKPINVFGDGNQTRVFCHVLDAVNAILRLISSEKPIGEVFNIGGREEVSIKDLASRVINLTKSNSKINYMPYSESYKLGFEDMSRRVPDLSKIKRIIDWSPTFNLDQIIIDTAKSLA